MKNAIVLLVTIFAVTVSPIQTVQAYDSNDIVHNSSGITGMQRADVIVKRLRYITEYYNTADGTQHKVIGLIRTG